MPLCISWTKQVLRQLNTCSCGENSTPFTNVILNNLRLPFSFGFWMSHFRKYHAARSASGLPTANSARKCKATEDLNSSARSEDVNAVRSRLRSQKCSIMGINGVWDAKFTCSWACVDVDIQQTSLCARRNLMHDIWFTWWMFYIPFLFLNYMCLLKT